MSKQTLPRRPRRVKIHDKQRPQEDRRHAVNAVLRAALYAGALGRGGQA